METEFRSTLETLKGRMEVAYNAKEQQAWWLNCALNEKKILVFILECLTQVEAELGTMREQLSSELRRAVGGGGSEKGDAHRL